jgi:hypothetical protein
MELPRLGPEDGRLQLLSEPEWQSRIWFLCVGVFPRLSESERQQLSDRLRIVDIPKLGFLAHLDQDDNLQT